MLQKKTISGPTSAKTSSNTAKLVMPANEISQPHRSRPDSFTSLLFLSDLALTMPWTSLDHSPSQSIMVRLTISFLLLSIGSTAGFLLFLPSRKPRQRILPLSSSTLLFLSRDSQSQSFLIETPTSTATFGLHS